MSSVCTENPAKVSTYWIAMKSHNLQSSQVKEPFLHICHMSFQIPWGEHHTDWYCLACVLQEDQNSQSLFKKDCKCAVAWEAANSYRLNEKGANLKPNSLPLWGIYLQLYLLVVHETPYTSPILPDENTRLPNRSNNVTQLGTSVSKAYMFHQHCSLWHTHPHEEENFKDTI